MNLQKIETIISQISLLSVDEIEFLKYKLFDENKQIKITTEYPNSCPNCGSIKFYKHDKRNNKQRFKCNDCSKTFTFTTESVFNYLHQSHYDKFRKFIECSINVLSLRRSAEICNISVSCAFKWRHKILKYITDKQQLNEYVDGLIEMDEIYFRKSKKGNHKNGIGRKPRRHGYDPDLEDLPGLSKDKVCFSTAIDRTKNVSINFIGFGKPNSTKLFNEYKEKITCPSNSKIITDGDKIYHNFAKLIGCELKMLSKHKTKDYRYLKLPIIEEINGNKYHIQNVNNFHSQINNIINFTYKGVGSKYLIQYINWVKWLRLNKSNFYLMVDKLENDLIR